MNNNINSTFYGSGIDQQDHLSNNLNHRTSSTRNNTQLNVNTQEYLTNHLESENSEGKPTKNRRIKKVHSWNKMHLLVGSHEKDKGEDLGKNETNATSIQSLETKRTDGERKIDKPNTLSDKESNTTKQNEVRTSRTSSVSTIPNHKILQTRSSPKIIISKTPTMPVDDSMQILEDKVNRCAEFITRMQMQLQSIQRNLDKDQMESQSDGQIQMPLKKSIIAQEQIRESLGQEWQEILQDMNQIFQTSMSEEERRRSISFRNLGIESQLDPKVIESLKNAFSKASKNAKGNKHLEIACKFLMQLFLDFCEESPFKDRSNIKKMKQFNTEQVEIPRIAFDYIESLYLLGEIIQKQCREIDDKHERKNPIFAMAHKFIKQLKEIKEIREVEQDDKRAHIINLCCQEFGNCILNYARTLAKRFEDYLQHNSEGDKYRQWLSPAINQNLVDIVTIKTSERRFGDYERAVVGKYLTLSTDRKDIPIPAIPSDANNTESLNAYTREVLVFLMKNLDINFNTDLTKFDPLTFLQNHKYIEHLYIEFEREWQKETLIKGKAAKMTGIFKLLPILRVFNQSILIGINSAMRGIETTLSDNISLKLDQDYPHPLESQKKLPGYKLDEETKHINLNFSNGIFSATVERMVALGKTNNYRESNDPNDFCFIDCSIKTQVILTASIQNMDNWKSSTYVLIKRPKHENMNIHFLKRFAALIATLEIQGTPYKITEV